MTVLKPTTCYLLLNQFGSKILQTTHIGSTLPKTTIFVTGGQRRYFSNHITHSIYIAHLNYDTSFNDDATDFICINDSIFESFSISHAFSLAA